MDLSDAALQTLTALLAGLALEQQNCSYGDLPGYWTPLANRTVGNWTTLDQDCQLQVRLAQALEQLLSCPPLQNGLTLVHAQDLVGHHLRLAKDSNVLSSDDIGILLLGDSADRNLIFDICLQAGQQVRPPLCIL